MESLQQNERTSPTDQAISYNTSNRDLNQTMPMKGVANSHIMNPMQPPVSASGDHQKLTANHNTETILRYLMGPSDDGDVQNVSTSRHGQATANFHNKKKSIKNTFASTTCSSDIRTDGKKKISQQVLDFVKKTHKQKKREAKALALLAASTKLPEKRPIVGNEPAAQTVPFAQRRQDHLLHLVNVMLQKEAKKKSGTKADMLLQNASGSSVKRLQFVEPGHDDINLVQRSRRGRKKAHMADGKSRKHTIAKAPMKTAMKTTTVSQISLARNTMSCVTEIGNLPARVQVAVTRPNIVYACTATKHRDNTSIAAAANDTTVNSVSSLGSHLANHGKVFIISNEPGKPKIQPIAARSPQQTVYVLNNRSFQTPTAPVAMKTKQQSRAPQDNVSQIGGRRQCVDAASNGITVTMVSQAECARQTLQIEQRHKALVKDSTGPRSGVKVVPVLKADGTVSKQLYDASRTSFVSSSHEDQSKTAATTRKSTKKRIKMAEICPVPKKISKSATGKTCQPHSSRPDLAPPFASYALKAVSGGTESARDLHRLSSARPNILRSGRSPVRSGPSPVRQPSLSIRPTASHSQHQYRLPELDNRKDVILSSVTAPLRPKMSPDEYRAHHIDHVTALKPYGVCEDSKDSYDHYIRAEASVTPTSEIFRLSQIQSVDTPELSCLESSGANWTPVGGTGRPFEQYQNTSSASSNSAGLKTSFSQMLPKSVSVSSEQRACSERSPSSASSGGGGERAPSLVHESPPPSLAGFRPIATGAGSPVKPADFENSNVSSASQGELLEYLQSILHDIPKQSPHKFGAAVCGGVFDKSPAKLLPEEIDLSTALNLADAFGQNLKTSPVKQQQQPPLSPRADADDVTAAAVEKFSNTQLKSTSHNDVSDQHVMPSDNVIESSCHSNSSSHYSSDVAASADVTSPRRLVINAPEIIDENTMDKIVRVVEDLRALGHGNTADGTNE